jgi:hypothetical protein
MTTLTRYPLPNPLLNPLLNPLTNPLRNEEFGLLSLNLIKDEFDYLINASPINLPADTTALN